MYGIFGLICIGLLGASLFTTGILFNMTSLVIAGICLTALVILGMLLYYLYGHNQRPSSQLQPQASPPFHNPAAYSSNNMNSMKRNKSDTDLELINRQSEDV